MERITGSVDPRCSTPKLYSKECMEWVFSLNSLLDTNVCFVFTIIRHVPFLISNCRIHSLRGWECNSEMSSHQISSSPNPVSAPKDTALHPIHVPSLSAVLASRIPSKHVLQYTPAASAASIPRHEVTTGGRPSSPTAPGRHCERSPSCPWDGLVVALSSEALETRHATSHAATDIAPLEPLRPPERIRRRRVRRCCGRIRIRATARHRIRRVGG